MARRRKFTVDKKTAAGRWLDQQAKVLAKKPRVKIGITQRDFSDPKEGLDEAGGRSTDITVGEVAVVNEFGSADKRIPERSFIRSTTDDQRRRVNAMIKRFKVVVIAGFFPAKKALGIVGAYMKDRIQNKIVMLKNPPNAPSTIARKGSSNPLIDKGQLRQKVDWVVQDGPNR